MPRHLDSETTDAAPSLLEEVRVSAAEALWYGKVFFALGTFVSLVVCIKTGVEWRRAVFIVPLWGAGSAIWMYGLTSVLFIREERASRQQARRGTTTRLSVAEPHDELPGRPIVPVTLDLVRGSHHTLLEMDITPELQAFAGRVIAWREDPDAPLGVTFSEAGYTRATGESKADAFIALRDEMMDRGLLRWKNPAHHLAGYQFRAGFDEAMRYVAEYPLPGRT